MRAPKSGSELTARAPASALLAAALLALPAPAHSSPATPDASRWPAAHPRNPSARNAAADEALIRRIVAGMTLEQKVGQMTQPNIWSVTPDDVRRYYLGSVLNGGGAWPGNQKHASVADWLALSKAYYDASMSTDIAVKIPVIWGTDAVHGHNNVYGATLYPHNIGLGAAHDPALIERIGRATARAVRATGITWVFAPAVAVAQNPRWGRFYESWSSDPALVRSYGEAIVRGLQGDLRGGDDVLANPKVWIGDGGTFHGSEQGDVRAPEAELINVHSAGFYGALKGGAETVMASYASWTDIATGRDWGKTHGNRYLLTDVLKKRLGFDGFVVSDWNGIEQIPGCTKAHCPQAINAGIDLVMVPDDWKEFIANTVADVKSGAIPMARIDDAVSRILRAKLRGRLFDASPATGPHPPASAISDPASRALARVAVRESLVLLKNERRALPLSRSGRVLVVGAGADSMADQTGGWSLTWQGSDNSNTDFPNGETILGAIRKTLGPDQVDYSPDGKGVNPRRYRAIVAVAAENAYAEGEGDLGFPATLRHTAHYPADLAALERVSGKGVPVVTILLSGRPVSANDLINRSDAFIAAWQPGTEAQGIADLLFAKRKGGPAYDFTGKLSFDWPAGDCFRRGEAPGFARGYGLSYRRPGRVARLPVGPAITSCPADSD
ncbi:MAG TPA: glycoside hydrolase family 3 protein [Sphingomicrobium sp.]